MHSLVSRQGVFVDAVEVLSSLGSKSQNEKKKTKMKYYTGNIVISLFFFFALAPAC